ncbi:MAG: hypothetical protein OXT09_03325, partial [Myxococcales bacterium]|nr:hypothetical protein [Myxococcales bacterium]
LVVLWVAGCGVQAGEEYLGEPLLEMRGQAVVAALTGGQPIEPALCFRHETDEVMDLTKMSAEVAEVFALSPELQAARAMGSADVPVRVAEAHIVSVESLGEFPSHFEVAVYSPPPEVVATAAFEGEPRKAVGEVCAALSGYGPMTHEVAISGTAGFCSDTECAGRVGVVTRDGERSYAKAYRCPAGVPYYDPGRCTETSAGDETLLFETYAEGVVGAARDPLIVYLADDAPAGSFAAWDLGAAEGLAAGYHVFEQPTPDAMNMRFRCRDAIFNSTAYPEIEEVYGDRIREELGEGYELAFLPHAAAIEDGAFVVKRLPDDVVAGAQRILAEYEMATCPMPEVNELEPVADEIALTIDVYDEAFVGWPGDPRASGGPTIP